MASQRAKINKRDVEEGHSMQAPISSSIKKGLKRVISISSAASSRNSSTTEPDTDLDYYGSLNPPERFSDGAILENGALQGPPKTWSDFDDHSEEEDYVQIYEDDYESEEMGDENALSPQRMHLSEQSLSPVSPCPGVLASAPIVR